MNIVTKTYRNNRNENKYIEVVRYSCGHYYMIQSMRWDNGVVNYLGVGLHSHRKFRVRKRWLDQILDDYTEVANGGAL